MNDPNCNVSTCPVLFISHVLPDRQTRIQTVMVCYELGRFEFGGVGSQRGGVGGWQRAPYIFLHFDCGFFTVQLGEIFVCYIYMVICHVIE